MAKAAKAPWKKANPRKRSGQASKHLTAAQKTRARKSAKRAGRSYPNLVDNMRIAKKSAKASKKNTSPKKKVGRKRAAHKTAASKKKTASNKAAKKRVAGAAAEKDPRGGLTAAGRKAFAKEQGAHLRPGVRKSAAQMSLSDMRRKGSWAVRFYGRAKLPPLVDAKGQPTRLALSAHAWGEPVPKTVAAARRIAAKGKQLLARYQRLKDK